MYANNLGWNVSRVGTVDVSCQMPAAKKPGRCLSYDDSFVGCSRPVALASTGSLPSRNPGRLPSELKLRLERGDRDGVLFFLLGELGSKTSHEVPGYALSLLEASAHALPFDCEIRHLLAQECLFAAGVEGVDRVSYARKAVEHARLAANLDKQNYHRSRTLLVDCLFEVLSLGLADMHSGPWQDAKMPYSQERLIRHLKVYRELLSNYMLDLPNYPDAALDILQSLLNMATFEAARQVVFDEVISRVELFRESYEQSVVLT